MNDTSSDNILLLKQRLAEQEALNYALLEKLADREREIAHLQAQLDKLRQPLRKGLPAYRTDGSWAEPNAEGK